LFEFPDGLRIEFPSFAENDLVAIIDGTPARRRELGCLTTRDVASFFRRVGLAWLDGGLEARSLADALGPRVTQYAPRVVISDYQTLGHFLASRHYTHDMVAAEFCDERVLDEWVNVQMSQVRAFPRGLALHYQVGNVPLASLFSLVRGMITRNENVAKVPARDPISALAFALALIEVDPDHPITRSTTVGYWRHDDPVGDRLLDAADTVCVWGGEEAVRSIKRRVRPNVPVAEYGPRWSASVIDLDALCDPDKDRAAYRLAEDVCFYDQEACFNSQRAFVRGDLDGFLPRLRSAFAAFAARVPMTVEDVDAFANRSSALLDAMYLGCETSDGGDWAVVVADDPTAIISHPLLRTLYVHPIADLGDVTAHLNATVQTLGVMPWSVTATWRDKWAAAGVDRMVDLGYSRIPREGFTHDGTLGLHSFVRIACVERPMDDIGKYSDRLDPLLSERQWFLDEPMPVTALTVPTNGSRR
jgi:long-chain-fatty-acyl-CoA reductase